MKKQHIRVIFSLLALCALVLVSLGAGAERQQRALAERVIRLHVLANSDTEADQAEKLRVRDAVLRAAEGLLEPGMTREQAAEALWGARDRLLEAASGPLGERPVSLSLGTEYYPTRSYERFSLPAGEYLSLRVKIGEAAGRNWWCVVFPPLCTELAEEETEAAWDLNREELALLTGEEGTVIRFRLIEWWQELRRGLSGG